jgi:predicted transcriptional regulator
MSVGTSIIKYNNKQKEVALMEQTETSVTIINATEDYLKSQVAEKDTRITQLEEHIQKVTQRSYADNADKNRMVEQMQEWTFSALESGTINEDEALEIAEICGFDLTKEFEVEVTVLYSVTVNARDEESAQNAIHDIDFDTVQYNSDDISWLSSSVDRIDI